MLLPAIMPHTALVTACIKAPRVKSTSATRMTFLRPNLSARIPASGLAIRANRLVQDVTRLLSNVVRRWLERSDPIDTKVAEMTPVLQRAECQYNGGQQSPLYMKLSSMGRLSRLDLLVTK